MREHFWLACHLPEPKGQRTPDSGASGLECFHKRGSGRCTATSLSGWPHITTESAQDTWGSTAPSAAGPQSRHLACNITVTHQCKATTD